MSVKLLVVRALLRSTFDHLRSTFTQPPASVLHQSALGPFRSPPANLVWRTFLSNAPPQSPPVRANVHAVAAARTQSAFSLADPRLALPLRHGGGSTRISRDLRRVLPSSPSRFCAPRGKSAKMEPNSVLTRSGPAGYVHVSRWRRRARNPVQLALGLGHVQVVHASGSGVRRERRERRSWHGARW
jgi:hypothetical protein